MSQELVLGLALIGAMAVISWIVWISTSIGDIGGLARGLERTRQEVWEKIREQKSDTAMLEQRIIELEKRKSK